MFTFGWKMLAAGLINTIYLELNSLIIGKRYTSSDLSFYTKGKAFPRSLTSGVDSALQSVMLSSFSKKQDNREELHRLMKMSAVTNTYVLTPILVFLAVAGAPIISLLLTDKWLPMLPYMQIACFSLAFHPLSSINMQVIAAVGRSDLRLKLEFIKKPIGLILLAVAISYGPLAIAISSAIASFVGLIIGFIACKKIVGYKISNSFKDIIPSWLAALSSGLFVYALNLLVVNNFLLLIIQLIVMACTYYVISKIFKLIGYQICKEKISTICQKK